MACIPVSKERKVEIDRLGLWDDDVEYMIPRVYKPDFTTTLKAVTEAMESHPWWHVVEGTPLANDLPVRATEAVLRMLKKT